MRYSDCSQYGAGTGLNLHRSHLLLRCLNYNFYCMWSASKSKCSPVICIFFHLRGVEGTGADTKPSSLKSTNPSVSQTRALFPMALLQWFGEKWTLLTESRFTHPQTLPASTKNSSQSVLSCGREARNPVWVGIKKNIYISPLAKKNQKQQPTKHVWIRRISRRCSWPIALQASTLGARQIHGLKAEADWTLQNLSIL